MISVIIPYYNNEATIQETIYSVQSELRNINGTEIIVIDDGSTLPFDSDTLHDSTWDCELITIRQANLGVSAARNAGIKNAQNPIIMFCDADDKWVQGKVSRQLEELANPDIMAAGSNWNEKIHPFSANQKTFVLNKHILPLRWWPHISTIAIRKKVFDTGEYYFDETMFHAEDGDWYLRLAKAKLNLVIINTTLAKVGFSKGTTLGSGLSSQHFLMYLGEIKCIRKHLGLTYLILISPIIALKYAARLVRNLSFKNVKYIKDV